MSHQTMPGTTAAAPAKTTDLDPLLRPASDLARLLADGVLGARELLEMTRRQVEAVNPSVHAVVTTDWERAEREAAAADEATASGRSLGPLHGLPMTVKDAIETAGLRTTCGTEHFAEHVPTSDAPAVARLRAAGAIVLGKSNLPAFASDAQSSNALFGTTCNPWDLDRTPGGSSGGAAVAVATGMSTLELGSDLGGSIRIPGHFCGVYGLKPTFGVMPFQGHLPPSPGTLSRIDVAAMGPLARSADDLDLALGVMAGASGHDAAAWRLALPPARATALSDYRIGIVTDDDACPVDRATQGALEALAESLRAAGVSVVDVQRTAPSLAEGLTLFRSNVQYLAGMMMTEEDLAVVAALPEKTEWQRNVTLSARDLWRAGEAREHYKAAWVRQLEDVDVVLMPTMPTQAFPHDHEPDVDRRSILVDGVRRAYGEQFAWVQAATVAHLPIGVAPLPLVDGLPMGVQVVGAPFQDRAVIDVARRLAEVTGGFVAPPRR